MKRILFGIMVLCLMVPLESEAKQTLYKWVDKNGTTHYSAKPPANQKVETVSVSTGHSAPVDKPKPETTEAATTAGQPTLKVTTSSTKNPEKCEKAKKNHWNLKTFPRIQVEDPDTGERRYLTPDEHKEWLAKAEKQVKEYCD